MHTILISLLGIMCVANSLTLFGWLEKWGDKVRISSQLEQEVVGEEF